MYTTKIAPPTNKFMDHDQPIRAIQIPCRYHTGSICLNYCHEVSCFKLLCEECIEEHLDHHKKNGLAVMSIKSFKKVRQFCSDKLTRLIEDLLARMSALKQPKNPQQILEQANMKFQAIKKLMFEIIEQQLSRFYDQLRIKVNESFSTLKNLQQVHENLSKIIMQLKESKGIIVEGSKQIPETVEKVLAMDENLYVETFSREAAGYAQKLAYVDFDVSMNQNKFRNSVSECLRISRNEPDQIVNTSAQFGKVSRMNMIKSPMSINTQSNRSRVKQAFFHDDSKDNNLPIRMETDLKFLHFFETYSNNLHLLDLSSPHNIRKEVIQLNNYIVPSFHASIMFPQGYLFISGGIVEVGDKEIKTDRLSKYSLKAKGTENFKKDFSRVRPRSSHSLCQYGDYLYILGGYGPSIDENVEAEKIVEKVNIRSGEVQQQTRSRYGGANISIAINGSILKASEEGVEVYNISSKKWTTIQVPENYIFIRGCGWTRISKECLFIYGGYNQDEEGLDTCKQWIFSQNELQVKNLSCKLPSKEGFLNNPGTIVEGNVYVLQNISIEDGEESLAGIEEGERALLVFDGKTWKQLNI